MLRFALTAWLACWIVPAFATDYFIDFVSGSNTNNGLSTNAPWKHLPGDGNASGNPAVHIYQPGNRYLLRRGVMYNGQVTINRSGTPSNPIVIDGNEWGTSGSKATNTTAFLANSSAYTISGAQTNIQLLDLGFYQIGGVAHGHAIYSGAQYSWSNIIGGFGVRAESNPGFLTCSNLTGEEIGYYTNHIINRSGTVINGYLLRVLGGRGHRFYDIRTTNVPVALSLQEGSGLLLTNVIAARFDISGMCRWGGDLASARANGTFGHILFEDWTVYNIHPYDTFNWLGGKNGTPPGADNPHTDGIFVRNPVGPTTWLMTNGVPTVVIDRFTWYSDFVGNGGSGTAPIYISQGPSVMVRNSIFGPTKMAYNIGVGHDNNVFTQRVYIVHCDFFNDARINVESETLGPTNIPRKVVIANNIFHRADDANNPCIRIAGASALNMIEVCNWNVFHHSVRTESNMRIGNRKIGTGGETGYTLSQWKALGYDLDSVFGDPLWTNRGTLGATSDLHIKSGSAAIGRGSDTYLAIAPVDRDGNPRVAPLDAGAYNFFSTSPPTDTNAPTPNPMTWFQVPSIVGDHAISMTWSTATDDSGQAVTYHVTETTGNVGCDGDFVTTGTNYVDTDIPFGTTCGYFVTAADNSGNETAPTPTVEASTPSLPALYSARVGNLRVVNMLLGPEQATNKFYLHAEGTGTQLRFSDHGSATDWDWNAQSIAGTNSFNAGDTTNASWTVATFGQTTNACLIGGIQRNATGPTKRKIGAFLSNGVEIAAWYFGTNGLAFTHGSASNEIALLAPANQWWRYRLEFAPASAGNSNGIMRAWLHTNLVFSQAQSAQITNGTSTGLFNEVLFGHTNGLPGNRFLYDETWMREGTNSLALDNATPGSPEIPEIPPSYGPYMLTAEGGTILTTEGGVIITTE